MVQQMKAALLIIIAVFLLSACTTSFKEEQKKIISSVETAMKKKPSKSNTQNEVIQYKLPLGFEIKKETPNNIILHNGSKTYILFYNQHENSLSQVVFQSTLQHKKEYDVKQTFKEKDKFGYLLIEKLSDKKNEMTVGIGGVKMTTEAKTDILASEATTMVDIVNSVSVK
ncbi:hypothetical protein ACE38V_12635 [Cytobacillus sp. Hz8]|uniref:hypothetical protein n=1 Tax=Cytobacillus sp. Hz8 TaxID=3347168 RepID=UPI0035E01CD3